MGLAQKQHGKPRLADAAADGVGEFAGEQRLVEGELPAAVAAGVKELFALNPVILLVKLGGFATNAAYCIFCNVKNRTGRDYFSVPAGVWVNNVLFCALAGVLWYSQFFGLGMGKSFFAEAPLMLAFSWSILMSLNVLFSNLWGLSLIHI